MQYLLHRVVFLIAILAVALPTLAPAGGIPWRAPDEMNEQMNLENWLGLRRTFISRPSLARTHALNSVSVIHRFDEPVTDTTFRTAATTYVWDGGIAHGNFTFSNGWTTPNNWQGGASPVSAADTDLVFAGTAFRTTANNNISDPFILRGLTFDAGNTAYNLTGGSLNLGSGGLTQNSTAIQTIGNNVSLTASQNWSFASGAGALNLGDDLSVGSGVTLGLSSGTVTLTSASRTLSVDGAIAATLNLSGTAALSTHSTTYAGLGGGGTVNQTGGSFSTNGNEFYLGASSTGVGVYNLSGSGSTLSTGNTYVGNSGSGAFTQTGGSFVTNGGTLYLGYNTGGIGSYTLSGNGSILSTSTTFVGYSGSGTFNQSGGSVSTNNSNFYVGYGAAGSGIYNLSAAGGTLSAANFVIGYDGKGAVEQSGGGVTMIGALSLGSNLGSSGTYALSGGTLSVGSAVIGNNGSGSFTQAGGNFTDYGSLILGFGGGSGSYILNAGTLTSANTSIYSGNSTFTQNGGTHTTDTLSVGNTSTANSTYNLNGGTLAARNVSKASTGTGTFNLNGGSLQARQNSTSFFQNLSNANVLSGGARIDTNGFNVTVAQPLLHAASLGSTLDGGLTKTGNGTLTLTGTNTYNGGTTISGGTLSVSSNESLGATAGSVTLLNSGQLVFSSGFITSRTYNLNAATVNFNGSLLSGATINGGFLSGSSVLQGATLNGVTTLIGSSLGSTPAGSTFNNTTIRGSLTFSAPGHTSTMSNGFITGAGTLTLGYGDLQAPEIRLNTSGTEIQGVTSILAAGTLANSGTNLYLTGGSRTTVNSGGTISTANGTSIELNGSVLTNNGVQSGVLNVNFGSLAKGSGTFGTVNVNDGGRFAPGNSPGTATLGSLSLASGGRYEFELTSVSATAGNGADFLKVLGNLDIAAGTMANSVFTIAIASLNSSNQPAALTDFDATQPYTFTLATALGGITGFAPNEFTVDTTGFGNSLQGGSFSVAQNGNSLELQFHPVPEPSSWAMIFLGIVTLVIVQYRSRSSNTQSLLKPASMANTLRVAHAPRVLARAPRHREL